MFNDYFSEFTILDDNYSVNVTDEYCETWFPGGRSPYLRTVKVFHIILGTCSMLSITFFLLRFKKFLGFHFNVKILFYFQLFACFTQAAVLTAFQTHHLITSLHAVEPCDVVLPKIIYAVFNIPLVFSLLAIESSIIFMVIERTVASCLFQCYEKSTKIIGIVFLAIAMFIPTSLMIYTHYDNKFDTPQMTAVSTSPGQTMKINTMFIVDIVLLVIALIHTIALYKHNERRNSENPAGGNLALSSRYQLAENVQSARLLRWITTAQLVIYLIYAISMYSLRMFLPGVRNATWQAITELLYIPPIYCALMPILCIITIRKTQKERSTKIFSLLQMRSTGQEGWTNYQSMLARQWV